MSIVLELQKESINPEVDILSLLRKSLLVAKKLGLKDFEDWINCELNGYKTTTEVPEYRKVQGELKVWNSAIGRYSPVLIPNNEWEEIITQRGVPDSIPSIYTILSSKEGQITISMPGAANSQIGEMVGYPGKYELFVSRHSFSNIIEQVKNKILVWSSTLEEQGITGEGLSFTEEEKLKANSRPEIINYISNFYGDISNTQIQQGVSNSVQKR